MQTQTFKPAALAHSAIFLVLLGMWTSADSQSLPQLPPPPTEPSLIYIVKPNDNLIVRISEMLNNPSDWADVARFNKLKNPNKLVLGQVLNIPTRLLKSQPVHSKVISIYGSVLLSGKAAAVGSLIGEGAKLQTGANSSAVIELGDGSRMTLLPNTLAELDTSRGYSGRDPATGTLTTFFSGVMRLAQGALDTLASKTARRATPLQITTPTSTMGVRGTEFRVAYDGSVNQNARTEVLEGLVRADITAQKAGADVAQGKGALLDPAARDIKVVNLLKAPDLAAIPGDILKPLALWPMPALEGANSYRVQIAVDDTFNKIVRDLVVTSGSVNLSSLPNGSWFARVRGIDASGIEGYDTVKAVQVVLPPPPLVPPTQWNITADRIDVVNGRHILQFSQSGLDASHTINASVATAALPAVQLAEASAQGNTPRITMDLGFLEPGLPLLLNLNVTQSDGAKVIPLTYRFESIGGWGWSEGLLQSVTITKP